MRGKITWDSSGKKHFFVNGEEVTERRFYRAFPPQPIAGAQVGGTPTKGWPIYSDGAGVHPKRIAEHERVCKARGVPTECLPDGRVIFRDRAHRKAYLKAFAMHDNNGGYGD